MSAVAVSDEASVEPRIYRRILVPALTVLVMLCAANGSVKVSRDGFDDLVRVSTTTLTEKVATRVGKKLKRRDLFKAGRRLGSSVTSTAPATVSVLPRGAVSFSLDSAFSQKLDSLFVAVNPVFPSERVGLRPNPSDLLRRPVAGRRLGQNRDLRLARIHPARRKADPLEPAGA